MNNTQDISPLIESSKKLLLDNEMLWKIVCAILENHPDKAVMGNEIRRIADDMLEIYASLPQEDQGAIAARANQALESLGKLD